MDIPRAIHEKGFERLAFLRNRINILSRRINKLSRMVTVLLTLLAWFSISNHCLFGAMLATGQSAMASMHCHGDPSSPSKSGDGKDRLPCCKVLRATITSQVKLAPATGEDLYLSSSSILAESIRTNDAQFHRAPLHPDAGPPLAVSFAESVLQQSIFAHAPPFLS